MASAASGWDELGDDISTLPRVRSRHASDAVCTSPWDLLHCGGEYDREVEVGSRTSSASYSATRLSLASTPPMFHADELQPWIFGAFTRRCSTLRAPEIPSRVRLKCSASAREVEIAHLSAKTSHNRGDMVPRQEEQSPLKLPATRGAASLLSLTSLITKLAARGKRLPKLALSAVMYQLTRAVAHANRLGVCHREVCPANVMVHASSYMTELIGWDHPPAN